MKLGETLNGFTIVTPPSNTDAGMSEWCHVEKDGERFFMKMYLAPKYPTASAPGTPAGKARRRAECERFEKRHLTIAHRLQHDSPGGGHLVTTLTFFRVGPCYYKVTRLVDVDRRVHLRDHDPQTCLIALRSLLYSVKLMHDQDIVHGDLKPDNVLFQRTAAGAVTCKLIDFDEAYITSEPPDVMHIVGDPIYYSPELFGYVKQLGGISAHQLTVRSDIFSLAILVHVLLTDDVPRFDTDRFGYPCEAVVAGEALALHDSLPSGPLTELLQKMLSSEPAMRPSIDEVITTIRSPEVKAALADIDRTPPAPEVDVFQAVPDGPPRRPTSDGASSTDRPQPARPSSGPLRERPSAVASDAAAGRDVTDGAEVRPTEPAVPRIRSTFSRTPMPAPATGGSERGKVPPSDPAAAAPADPRTPKET